MFCVHCASNLPDGYHCLFCPFCGKKLPLVQTKEAQDQHSGNADLVPREDHGQGTSIGSTLDLLGVQQAGSAQAGKPNCFTHVYQCNIVYSMINAYYFFSG